VAFHKFMMKAKSFRGTAGQLLQELNAAESIAKGHRWPQNPRALSGRLRRDAKLLAEIEMVFDIKQGRNRHRLMVAQVKMAPEPPENVGRPAKEGPQGRASRRKAAPAIAREAELPLFG
jgi:hypothetical protein